ncbi:MAG: MoaD/ThiS family protein [Anaerolineaceae bacterium]
MSVEIILRDKVYHIPAGQTLGKAMKTLGFPPESYLAVRHGEMITEDVILKEGDQIQLVAVISGGASA